MTFISARPVRWVQEIICGIRTYPALFRDRAAVSRLLLSTARPCFNKDACHLYLERVVPARAGLNPHRLILFRTVCRQSGHVVLRGDDFSAALDAVTLLPGCSYYKPSTFSQLRLTQELDVIYLVKGRSSVHFTALHWCALINHSMKQI